MAKRRRTARTTQRHRALDVIFEADEKDLLEEEQLLHLLTERRSVSTAQTPIGDFGAQIVEAYASHADNIDTIIEAASEDWAMARMNVVDRTILRAGSAELMFMGTPRALVVTEWSALARELSTDRSVGFVMGVLNRVADIRARELGQDDAGAGEAATLDSRSGKQDDSAEDAVADADASEGIGGSAAASAEATEGLGENMD
ncbi:MULTISPECIES: transcription antitermination factor NusB [unclassified Actinobaculum]|uniref:transcription antitermination protein NusB n=1 Tax=unclassified Actinobaculum TaxID=2609299 RepID=UPI000D528E6D|nr:MULTISPECIES: transcription antitermination factor NusB [unclassified Actinobaculum]AWE42376.1 transcription antitermination protein NusB [Actinobaculum sp. 313]RTE48362.1 transcription antitermination protein NusB [Actinobaculum sp. 352]